MHMKVDLRLLTGQPCELGGLQRALEGAPTYAERVSGHQPAADAATRLLSALPAGMTYDSKYVYGFMIDGPQMIGCVDIIRGWPEPGTALIGLLLLREKDQGRGLGRSVYELVEAKIRR
ncbi:MAG: GNAT family N-acetyltransferase [Pseudonocardiaceae bacterium]